MPSLILPPTNSVTCHLESRFLGCIQGRHGGGNVLYMLDKEVLTNRYHALIHVGEELHTSAHHISFFPFVPLCLFASLLFYFNLSLSPPKHACIFPQDLLLSIVAID